MANQPIPFGKDCATSSIQQGLAAPPAVEQEMLIDIYPRGYDCWTGTSAQLIGEGLVPADFKWPVGKSSHCWEANGFSYWLHRRRPDGHKGPMRSWLEIDHWRLRRTLSSRGRDGFAAARLYEKRQALAEELWSNTPAYREQWSRYWAACSDEAFQRFKALIVPEQKKRGRRSKGAETSPPASA